MADIHVNADQWNALAQKDQEKIIDGLQSTGSLKIGDNIIADPSAPPFDPDSASFELMWNPKRDLCLIACDTAAGLAFAWCTANTAGLGYVACMAAAEAVRNKCRESCG